MVHRLEIADFLKKGATTPVLDVRTPAEFQQGRIPGALNLPLFSDEERAEIGTLYKQVSREAAFMRGLDLVGPRMTGMVRQAESLAPGRQALVHCWRGGQRSESVGWLLNTAGFEIGVLEGGYKAYRNHVLSFFDKVPFRLLVLGGPTGSGKTEVLHAMEARGAQVVDLEKLANHKGSAFGSLGEEAQPSSEHFENMLFEAFSKIDPSRPVWIEHESRGIGRVYLPDPFWRQMMENPLVLVDPGMEARLDHAMDVYGHFETPLLKSCFIRVQNRMGGQYVKAALEAIDAGDIRAAAAIALAYYDKTYSHHLEKYPHADVRRLSIEGMSRPEAAAALINLENSIL